ncbi:FMN-dependent NADH-azoreductase [Ralstonia solanacearum]|uniref:FMN dependent NADH:quinone oxidoreductase n=1 Tax=Ralstonia solanacearum (strain Po82) TaxID=1031711 RepID=F6G978_RALS8|nr:NAD(P)H-dependent oxidoreductase [Ralstonia solanacearum]AEG71595.1 acyl carrier protein phosphodiesterase [Ralstonia solanacearum Po82]AMP71522.1 FMN-dependent NADH-azoreductase [Ralstonia solanacearum]AMP76553.1 FMN-dependent NADH-azoreductase [Ralstonia solanacearum]AYB62930.1 FMN-dependent NADH-azoreductase [Ralstonia solanacearum]EUJ12519.1 FMN-dependent NADH-azoreductase [Ralstonia solanacearum P673]
MSHILLITSSPRGADGLSTRFAGDLARKFAGQRPASTLTIRDLSAHPLAHIDAAYVDGRMVAPEARTPAQAEAVSLAETLIAELRAADTIVIGSAMTNFGPSTQLRTWFDHVIWPGVTFNYGSQSMEGLVTGKKVYLVTTSGGVFSEGPFVPLDYQAGYLKHLLGFIGMTDVELLRVEGTAYGPEAAQAAIEKADAAVDALLAQAA